MKKRYLYLLLFGIPCFFISTIFTTLIGVLTLGVFWIFLFGDNPWPPFAEKILFIIMIFIFLIAWATFLYIGFTIGKKLEKYSGLNKRDIHISIGITCALIILVILNQLIVGNIKIGPKSDHNKCGDFCKKYCKVPGKPLGYSSFVTEDLNGKICNCNCKPISNKNIKIMLKDIDNNT